MSVDQIRDRLADELTEPLLAVALDLEAVELTAAGKRRILRIAVDKDGGVTMDDIAAATRVISGVLDVSDAMGEQPYTLEVTSRGVDRPLVLPRHWRRNEDRLVKIWPGIGDDFTGRIVAADDAGATVDVDGTSRQIGYADIDKAIVQIEFNRKED